jgi:hypothetical protein
MSRVSLYLKLALHRIGGRFFKARAVFGAHFDAVFFILENNYEKIAVYLNVAVV